MQKKINIMFHRKWLKLLPILILTVIAVICGIGYLIIGSGWDSLGFLIILILCAAPAIGCIIGFAADWIWHRHKYKVSWITPVLLAALPVLVVGMCFFEEWYSFRGLKTIEDIPTKETVVAYLEEKGEAYATKELSGYMDNQLHAVWGEPDEQFSGRYGDIWKIDDTTGIIVIYDDYGNGIVEQVKLGKTRN